MIKTRLTSHEMNDICLYNSGSLFKALNPEEYFVDLSDQDFVGDYEDSYKETVSVGDAVYGVPATSTQVVGWLYNKNVYEELDLEVPTTWDELMANCEAIKAAGKTAVIGSYKDTWTAQPVFLGDAYSILQGERRILWNNSMSMRRHLRILLPRLELSRSLRIPLLM